MRTVTAERRTTRTGPSPRLAMARAIASGQLPPSALGDDLDDAMADLERVEHWRLPAMAD